MDRSNHVSQICSSPSSYQLSQHFWSTGLKWHKSVAAVPDYFVAFSVYPRKPVTAVKSVGPVGSILLILFGEPGNIPQFQNRIEWIESIRSVKKMLRNRGKRHC